MGLIDKMLCFALAEFMADCCIDESALGLSLCMWRFPKRRGAILGFPIMRIIVCWVFGGSLIWGNRRVGCKVMNHVVQEKLRDSLPGVGVWGSARASRRSDEVPKMGPQT